MKYLISVFIQDKCVHLFFADDLDDLVTIVAVYKHCDLSVFDLPAVRALTYEEVCDAVVEARERWGMQRTVAVVQKAVVQKGQWRRRIMCVETGQVFSSLRECADHTGIPYTTIAGSIRRGKSTRGVHFVIVEPESGDDGKES